MIDVLPHVLRWMESVLLDRTRQVKIGKTVPSVGNTNCGVLRCTVSAPYIVLFFINDLTTTTPIHKYADDSTIFEVCHEGDTIHIQESVDTVDCWTNQN